MSRKIKMTVRVGNKVQTHEFISGRDSRGSKWMRENHPLAEGALSGTNGGLTKSAVLRSGGTVRIIGDGWMKDVYRVPYEPAPKSELPLPTPTVTPSPEPIVKPAFSTEPDGENSHEFTPIGAEFLPPSEYLGEELSSETIAAIAAACS